MATVNPYVNFNGTCEAAFTFYKSVFGGEFPFVGKFKDMPPQEGSAPLSETDGEKIMHISLPISKETILMGSDCLDGFGGPVIAGTNFTISITAGSKEEADKIFNGLSAGGKVNMPMANTFWGSYFGMFVDKFGIPWMVSFNQSGAE
jgi:PhnB protein